jgi:hypothetical protein
VEGRVVRWSLQVVNRRRPLALETFGREDIFIGTESDPDGVENPSQCRGEFIGLAGGQDQPR